MTSYSHDLQGARLQDVNGRALLPHVPNPLARECAGFLVEYGIRVDDQAMIFHFFSPISSSGWDPAYEMDKRLKGAIDANFPVERVTAGFAEEMDSFYVIVGALGAAPDPWPLVERFLRDVEGQPTAGPS